MNPLNHLSRGKPISVAIHSPESHLNLPASLRVSQMILRCVPWGHNRVAARFSVRTELSADFGGLIRSNFFELKAFCADFYPEWNSRTLSRSDELGDLKESLRDLSRTSCNHRAVLRAIAHPET